MLTLPSSSSDYDDIAAYFTNKPSEKYNELSPMEFKCLEYWDWDINDPTTNEISESAKSSLATAATGAATGSTSAAAADSRSVGRKQKNPRGH